MRLDDNGALHAAIARAAITGGEVLPLFVVEPALLAAPDTGALHLEMISAALGGLRTSLRDRGADLLVMEGALPALFDDLVANASVVSIDAEEETGVMWSYERDRAVRRWARDRGIPLQEHPHGGVVRRLGDRDRRIAEVHRRLSTPPPAAPAAVPCGAALQRWIATTAIPTRASWEAAARRAGRSAPLEWPTGAVQRCDEAAARRTLASFLERRGDAYAAGISSPTTARSAASRLSVHLAWGTLTVRRAMGELAARRDAIRATPATTDEASAERRQWARSLSAFESRLFWHDHFCQRLEDEPTMEVVPLNHAFEALPFDGNGNFEAWITGRTGFPMVDASVRSLAATGYLNFRMRAMLVSAAVHLLHIDWRLVRDPMARMMADYLPGIHLSQLQMQAGLAGINTLRVYNPTKQLEDHDPECRFVHRWVPELRAFDPAVIRRWSQLATGGGRRRDASRVAAAADGQRELFGGDGEADSGGGRHRGDGVVFAGVGPLGDYASPVVDYRASIAAFRDAYFTIRRSADGRAESERVLAKHGSRKGRGRR